MTAHETILRGSRVLLDPANEAEEWLRDGGVVVVSEEVKETGRFSDLIQRYPDARVVGDGSHVVMPGLVDAHSHGHGLSRIQAGVFFDFLENMILDWPWRVALPSHLAAALTAVRHLRMGFTTTHHFGWDDPGPGAIPAAEKAIKAYLETGIRLAYNPAVRNMNRFACDEKDFLETLPPDLRTLAEPFTRYDADVLEDQYFELFEHLYARFNGGATRILMGPSWAHGCTPKLLTRIKERADALDGLPIHIHCLQTPHQRAYGFKKYGKSLLDWLDGLGLVDRNTVFSHTVWVSDRDVALLAERDAATTHHASCNFHVRNGIAPLDALLRAGICVGIGIDDKSINDDDDPFMEMRLIHKIHRIAGFDLEKTRPLTARQVLKIGTVNGARVTGFEGRIGALKPGMLADAILLDPAGMADDPWVASDIDWHELLVHRAKGSDVRTVMVGGKIVVEDGRFVDYDVEALYDEVRAFCAKGIPEKVRAQQEPVRRLLPHYQRWHNAMLQHLDVSEPYYLLNGRK